MFLLSFELLCVLLQAAHLLDCYGVQSYLRVKLVGKRFQNKVIFRVFCASDDQIEVY